ncbi:hypothetical protein EC988_010326, partial [Linderina pennispora]
MTLHAMCHAFPDSTSGTSCSFETMWIPVTSSWTPWTYDPETYTGSTYASYSGSWETSLVLEGSQSGETLDVQSELSSAPESYQLETYTGSPQSAYPEKS